MLNLIAMRKNKAIQILGYILLFLFVVGEFQNLLKGNVKFSFTFLVYGILLFISTKINKALNWQIEKLMLIYSILISLFIAELSLRYIFKTTLTYTEKQWGVYVSPYDLQFRYDRIKSFFVEDLKDEHLNFFEPFSLREYKTPEFDFGQESLNKMGLRGSLPDSTQEVIGFFGDSFTESVGAPKDSTLPKLFANKIDFSNTQYGVINSGISGSDPFFAFKQLQYVASFYSIKHAFFILNESDLNDVIFRGGQSRFIENGKLRYRKSPSWEPIYAASHVFRLIAEDFFGITKNLMTIAEYKDERKVAVNLIYKWFAEDIMPWCSTRNIKVHLVIIPTRYDFIQISDDYLIMEEKLSKVDNVNYCPIYLPMKAHNNSNEFYWQNDGHPNSKGCNLIAECIANCWIKSCF